MPSDPLASLGSGGIAAYVCMGSCCGEAHQRNERKVWTVIAICAAMMVVEIAGDLWFGSVALIADGLHMSTHAGALLIAALAYTYPRRYAGHNRLAFGTARADEVIE